MQSLTGKKDSFDTVKHSELGPYPNAIEIDPCISLFDDQIESFRKESHESIMRGNVKYLGE